MRSGRSWRQLKLRSGVEGLRSKGRLLAIASILATLGFIGAGVLAAPASAYNGTQNKDACLPYWGPSWTNNESNDLNQATYSPCANIPYGQYGQIEGNTTVSWYPSGNPWVYFYVQQNPDQYTQLSINGPYDSGNGGYDWYAYWQLNPSCWYSDQVNTYSGGPYWHANGYRGTGGGC